jgi:hypothetical protein
MDTDGRPQDELRTATVILSMPAAIGPNLLQRWIKRDGRNNATHARETQRNAVALVKGKKQEDDKSRDFIGMDNVHSGQGFLFSFSKICDIG